MGSGLIHQGESIKKLCTECKGTGKVINEKVVSGESVKEPVETSFLVESEEPVESSSEETVS